MEENVIYWLLRVKKLSFIFFVLILVSIIQGCASSQVSRNAATTIDNVYLNSTSSRSEFSVEQAYQNSSQKSKGILIGGVTGGLLGSITNGVGAFAGATTGAILGGALGAYIDANTTLIDRLNNRAVKVLVLGDQVLVVIPSNRIFYELSPNIRESAFSTLDLVSELIGSYVNISARVVAYTNDSGNSRIDCALTQQQAERVAKYIWKNRCLDTRLLYATGAGGSHLVTENSPFDINNDNYRIEITFEKLPA